MVVLVVVPAGQAEVAGGGKNADGVEVSPAVGEVVKAFMQNVMLNHTAEAPTVSEIKEHLIDADYVYDLSPADIDVAAERVHKQVMKAREKATSTRQPASKAEQPAPRQSLWDSWTPAQRRQAEGKDRMDASKRAAKNKWK